MGIGFLCFLDLVDHAFSGLFLFTLCFTELLLFLGLGLGNNFRWILLLFGVLVLEFDISRLDNLLFLCLLDFLFLGL